ncbi:Mitochondrial PGP phosphatase [Candidatus Izimaplasma bacterium HR1]|jgi:HAD superfamily phosphatase (TIGR01668 family)|uniref:YqeG family HAD IIIA-type phosphatase n=1 Tax=Candidatus Izimoplasma sp. HR1 TaxID=1541959 RepID=UPI0004F89023|nr:Mitochondrial PGP phosphatase [Candidatus Izimaplasma bacterium HR1]
MLHLFLKTKRFIPSEFHNSFFEIDFKGLYKKGYRTILSDLDNTLISYDEQLPTNEINLKFKELQEIGFELILISNNIPSRVDKFTEKTNIKGFANARKPLLVGINKAISSAIVKDLDRTILVGDQLMTDIWAANRVNVYSVLVNPLKKKTEKWYTKINRKTEQRMLGKIKKHYPNKYNDLKLDLRK